MRSAGEYYDEKMEEKNKLQKDAKNLYRQEIDPSYRGNFRNDGTDAFRHESVEEGHWYGLAVA